MCYKGELALWQGDFALARPWCVEGLAIRRTLGRANTSQRLGGWVNWRSGKATEHRLKRMRSLGWKSMTLMV